MRHCAYLKPKGRCLKLASTGCSTTCSISRKRTTTRHYSQGLGPELSGAVKYVLAAARLYAGTVEPDWVGRANLQPLGEADEKDRVEACLCCQAVCAGSMSRAVFIAIERRDVGEPDHTDARQQTRIRAPSAMLRRVRSGALQIVRQFAAVLGELRHDLLMQPDVHSRGVAGVARVM